MTVSSQRYLGRSIAFERDIVTYVQECEEITADPRRDVSLRECADRLATSARRELRRCLQARSLVRRMQERQREEIVLALCRAGLTDHAGALVSGNWQRQGLVMDV